MTVNLSDLFTKVTGGYASTAEIKQLQDAIEEKKKEQEKIEKSSAALIEKIKAAGFTKEDLLRVLVQHDLIELPKNEAEAEKLVIFESDAMQWDGNARFTIFTIWAGRDLKAQAAVKKKWLVLKAKGRDYFDSKLNLSGKAYAQTDEGKKYIEDIFKIS